MSQVRMGYVGCGHLAQKVHLPNMLLLDECDLLAVAEVRPRLGQMIQEKLRIPRLYCSHLELAKDPEIQAVAVSGQISGQSEIAIDLLNAGKDVFMEKPMAITIAQAERLLEAERWSGKRLMLAYKKRYDSGYLMVKSLLDQYRASGELGPLRYVRVLGFCGDWIAGLDTPFVTTDEPYPAVDVVYPDWLPVACRDGYIGYLQQYCHNLNLVRWLLDAGDNVKVVTTDLDRADGYSGVVILQVNGVRTLIESGGIHYHGWEDHTQFYFEGGWVKTDSPPLLLRNVPATVEVYQGNCPNKVSSSYFPENGRLWSYKEEMRHFIQCLLSGAPFRSPAGDSITDVRLMEAIYRHHVESKVMEETTA